MSSSSISKRDRNANENANANNRPRQMPRLNTLQTPMDMSNTNSGPPSGSGSGSGPEPGPSGNSQVPLAVVLPGVDRLTKNGLLQHPLQSLFKFSSPQNIKQINQVSRGLRQSMDIEENKLRAHQVRIWESITTGIFVFTDQEEVLCFDPIFQHLQLGPQPEQTNEWKRRNGISYTEALEIVLNQSWLPNQSMSPLYHRQRLRWMNAQDSLTAYSIFYSPWCHVSISPYKLIVELKHEITLDENQDSKYRLATLSHAILSCHGWGHLISNSPAHVSTHEQSKCCCTLPQPIRQCIQEMIRDKQVKEIVSNFRNIFVLHFNNIKSNKWIWDRMLSIGSSFIGLNGYNLSTRHLQETQDAWNFDRSQPVSVALTELYPSRIFKWKNTNNVEFVIKLDFHPSIRHSYVSIDGRYITNVALKVDITSQLGSHNQSNVRIDQDFLNELLKSIPSITTSLAPESLEDHNTSYITLDIRRQVLCDAAAFLYKNGAKPVYVSESASSSSSSANASSLQWRQMEELAERKRLYHHYSPGQTIPPAKNILEPSVETRPLFQWKDSEFLLPEIEHKSRLRANGSDIDSMFPSIKYCTHQNIRSINDDEYRKKCKDHCTRLMIEQIYTQDKNERAIPLYNKGGVSSRLRHMGELDTWIFEIKITHLKEFKMGGNPIFDVMHSFLTMDDNEFATSYGATFMLPTFWYAPQKIKTLFHHISNVYGILDHTIDYGQRCIHIIYDLQQSQLLGGGYASDKSFFFDNIDVTPNLVHHPTNREKDEADLASTETAVNITTYAQNNEFLENHVEPNAPNQNILATFLSHLTSPSERYDQIQHQMAPFALFYELHSHPHHFVEPFYTQFLDVSPQGELGTFEIRIAVKQISYRPLTYAYIFIVESYGDKYINLENQNQLHMIHSHYPIISQLLEFFKPNITRISETRLESTFYTYSVLRLVQYIITEVCNIGITTLDLDESIPVQ